MAERINQFRGMYRVVSNKSSKQKNAHFKWSGEVSSSVWDSYTVIKDYELEGYEETTSLVSLADNLLKF